jgi:hypothetical protein
MEKPLVGSTPADGAPGRPEPQQHGFPARLDPWNRLPSSVVSLNRSVSETAASSELQRMSAWLTLSMDCLPDRHQ